MHAHPVLPQRHGEDGAGQRYVLRPLAQDEALARCGTPRQAMDRMKDGALYNLSAEERTRLDAAVFDLVNGCCLLLFPWESSVLSLNVGTEEKRSISSPSNETVLKAPGTPLWRACAPIPASSAAT